MKKKLSMFLAAGLFTLLICLSLFEVGCTSVTPMFGNVAQVIVGDDYEAAGKAVGEAGYTAYVILKGNPKYDKYTKKCEELYAALDAADSDVNIGTINTVAMEVMNAALTVKYGYAKAQLITTGVRIGGAVADRIIAKRVDAVAAEQFLRGFKNGIDNAKSIAIPTAPTDVSSLPNYITCTKGNKCRFTFTDRTTAVQLAIAKELDDYKFLDKNEKRTDEYVPTKAENVIDLIGMLEKMLELGESTSNVWISEVCINENGKLDSIKFLYDDDGVIKATDCVSCVR